MVNPKKGQGVKRTRVTWSPPPGFSRDVQFVRPYFHLRIVMGGLVGFGLVKHFARQLFLGGDAELA